MSCQSAVAASRESTYLFYCRILWFYGFKLAAARMRPSPNQFAEFSTTELLNWIYLRMGECNSDVHFVQSTGAGWCRWKRFRCLLLKLSLLAQNSGATLARAFLRIFRAFLYEPCVDFRFYFFNRRVWTCGWLAVPVYYPVKICFLQFSLLQFRCTFC